MDGAIEQQLDSELVALEEATAGSLAAFAQTSTAKPESRELMQTIQGNMSTMRAKTRDLELLAEELDTPEESETLARRVNEHKAQYERLQKAWREANLQACSADLLQASVGSQARRNGEVAAAEERRALLGSGDPLARLRERESRDGLLGSAAAATASLQRTRQLMTQELEHTSATLAAMGAGHATLANTAAQYGTQRARVQSSHKLLGRMRRASLMDSAALWGGVALFAMVVAYVVVRRLAYFVPSGMLPSLATLSGRGSFVPDNLGDPALMDGDVFYDPAKHHDVNPEPYAGLDDPGAASHGASAAGEPEWRSAKEVMAEQARLVAQNADDRDTAAQSTGAVPSAAPTHGADAAQHGGPADTGGPGAVRDAVTQTIDNQGAAARQPEAGGLAEPAVGTAADAPPPAPPASVPPPPPRPAAPAAGTPPDAAADGAVHDERSDAATRAAPAAVAEQPMSDVAHTDAHAAGSETGPAIGEGRLGTPGAAAGMEPDRAPAGGESEAPETEGPAERAAVGRVSGAAASAAAPAADQADGGSEGGLQGAAGDASAGGSASSGAEAKERNQVAPTPLPGAEHEAPQPPAGEASPAHAPGGDPNHDPDPAAAGGVGECAADSAGTCAAPPGPAHAVDAAAVREDGASELAAASADGEDASTAAAAVARPSSGDGAPDALGDSPAAAEAVPGDVDAVADTAADNGGAPAPSEAAAAGVTDAHLGAGEREPSKEPHADHATASAGPPNADAAPLPDDAAAATAGHGSKDDSAAHEPADGGLSAGGPLGTPADPGPGVSEQAHAMAVPAEPKAAAGFAAEDAPADTAVGAPGAALHEPAGGREPGFLDAVAPAQPAGAPGRGADSMGSGPADASSLQASLVEERLESEREDWTGEPASNIVAGLDGSEETGAEGLGGLVGHAGTGELQSTAAERMPAAVVAESRPAAHPAAPHEGSTADMLVGEPVLRDEL